MFLGELLDELNMSIEDIGEAMQKNPFRTLPRMILSSARAEAELDGVDFDLKLRDIVAMIEEDGGIMSEQLIKFMNAFTESLSSGIPSDGSAEGGDKEPKK